MYVISIATIKGGTGKTLTTINLAGEIAKYGRVLLIDNDSQSNLSQRLNVKNDYTMYDLYSNNKVKFEDCICYAKDNIFIIPNKQESASLERQLRSKNADIILLEKWKQYAEKFDFVLIDNTPFPGVFMKNSLAMSDYYIEVIDNSDSALQSLNMVNNLINEIKDTEVNTNIKLLGILRNRFERKTVFGKQFNDALDNIIGKDLFNTIVYESIKYKEANTMHQTIQEYNVEYAKPYESLLAEIIHRINTK